MRRIGGFARVLKLNSGIFEFGNLSVRNITNAF